MIDATKFGRAVAGVDRARAGAGTDRDRRRLGGGRRGGIPSSRGAAGDRREVGRNELDGTTRNAVHRPVGGPGTRGARRQVRRLGLRRPRAGVLGRSLRRRRGDARLELRGRAAGAARAPRARRAGRSATTSWARPCAIRSTSATRAWCRRDLGRRRPRGRAAAPAERDEGHRAGGRAARRRGRHRLHRLADLAHALLVPAQRLRRGRARLPGVRRALGADHRRVRGRGREVRARGAPDRDRLRLRHHAQGAGGDRRPPRLRDQLRPEPLRAPVPRLGGVHHRVRAEDLPRAHQGLGQAARRALVDPRRAPQLRRARPRLGLRLARPRRRRLRER